MNSRIRRSASRARSSVTGSPRIGTASGSENTAPASRSWCSARWRAAPRAVRLAGLSTSTTSWSPMRASAFDADILTGMEYAESLLDLVGNTPLVRLATTLDLPTDAVSAPLVLAKVEYLNPGGSVKDRIAARMVEAAEASGELQPGGTIVEPTSGNTGVGLAMVAQAKGYRCVFVCPDKVSEDKRNVLKAYGAEVVVCPTAVPPEHPDSYYSVSDRLAREIDGGWKPDQYSNPEGPASHYATTGPEIWRDTAGKVTHFVTGVGTGGTISGTGRYLKEVSADRRRG